jgi:hypothetical protein
MSDIDITPDMEVQLELRERLNVPQILQEEWMSINRAVREANLSMNKIQEMILNFYSDIPDTWKDKEWEEGLENCVTVKRSINPARKFSGVIIDEETCKELGIEPFIETRRINYRRLKSVIINLLDRREMLVRRQKIEYSTGKNLDQTLDDLIKEQMQEEMEDETEED